MHSWFRRFLIVLTIGGGFIGLVLGVPALLYAGRTDPQCLIEAAVFGPLYAYAIFLGLQLGDGRKPLWGLMLYFGLQIPWIDCSSFSYRFYSGAVWAMVYSENGQNWVAAIGWLQQLRLLPNTPISIGLNAIAFLILFALLVAKFTTENDDAKGLTGESRNDTAS